jgi:dsRNA-specific ribonuclease
MRFKEGLDAIQLQAKVMDVGARAGYYTEKSPKMLLHEWCLQQKRPTPRYRSTEASDSTAPKYKVSCHSDRACACRCCIQAIH